jgi:hypothetical protein
MKKILLLFLCFFALTGSFASLQFNAGKKTNTTKIPDNDPTAVIGIWTGGYQTDQVWHEPHSVTFMILPDGVFFKRCKVVGNTDEYSLAKGTWSLDGNVFQYRDTAILYSGGTVINVGTAILKDNQLVDFRWKDLAVQSYTGDFLNVKKISSDPSSKDLPGCTTTP